MVSVTATPQIGQITSVLRRASDATGTDFDYLLRTAQRESSLRPHAKAKTSTATGLFQFIDETWLATLKKSGHRFGYGEYADAIQRMRNGRHNVSDPALRSEILALRKDPLAASLMAGAYTRDAAERLTDALGRTPLKGELYVAHFLGPGGAIRLIKAAHATPDKAAADMFPRAARANRYAFYNQNGEERTVKDLYTKLISIYGPGKAKFAETRTAATTETPETSAPAKTTPPDPRHIEPVATHFRLASHFQNLSLDNGKSMFGRPFQSLFLRAAAQPAPAETRPVSGPMNIIPGSVRVAAQEAPAPLNDGAILSRPGGGPTNIIPRAPTGLLQKYTMLHHNLFRDDPTDPQGI